MPVDLQAEHPSSYVVSVWHVEGWCYNKLFATPLSGIPAKLILTRQFTNTLQWGKTINSQENSLDPYDNTYLVASVCVCLCPSHWYVCVYVCVCPLRELTHAQLCYWFLYQEMVTVILEYFSVIHHSSKFLEELYPCISEIDGFSPSSPAPYAVTMVIIYVRQLSTCLGAITTIFSYEKDTVNRAGAQRFSVVRPLTYTEKYFLLIWCEVHIWHTYHVQSTCSMRKHAKLGGLGACSPRKILKIRCSEIASDGYFN